MHDGREDGREPRVEQRGEPSGIDPFDVADEAEVDGLGRAAAGRDDVGIGPREADGVASGGLEPGDDLLVGQPGVDHRNYVEHPLVGDAAPLDHADLQLEPFGQPRGELAAAVDEDLPPGQGGELLQKALECRGIVDDVAADLYDRDCLRHASSSSSRLSTTWAEISRFAASGITSERGDSITESVTIMLRRTGRQCMK